MRGVLAAALGGSALIVLVLALRLALQSRLPRRLFPALWCIAAARLLLRPFALRPLWLPLLLLCLRPLRVRYGFQPQHQMDLQGVIRQKYYSGGMQHTLIALSDRLTVNAVTQASEMDQFQIGDRVYVGWNQTHAPVVPDEKLDLEAAEGGKG